MQKVLKMLLPWAAAWSCVACGGGAEMAPPVPLAAPVVSSTAATAPAAEPVVFRACCDSTGDNNNR